MEWDGRAVRDMAELGVVGGGVGRYPALWSEQDPTGWQPGGGVGPDAGGVESEAVGERPEINGRPSVQRDRPQPLPT